MAKKALKFDIRAEDKTAQAFRSVKGKISSLTAPLFNVKTAIAGALGAAGVGAVAGNIMATADKMHKLNLRLGVSTESLSQMKHAAELSGIEFNTLTMAVQRSTRRIAEAAMDTGEAKDALEELGMDANALNMMKPDEQILAIADAMEQVTGESDKVRLAMKLFDSEGVAMLQLLASGRDGMHAMMQEADKLGLTLSQTAAEDIASANDAMGRMKSAMGGVVKTVIEHLAPSITDIADGIAYWVAENRDLIAQGLPNLLDDLRFYFESVVDYFKQNQQMLEYGVVGYFLFGGKGALVLAWVGSALDRIKAIKAELDTTGSVEMAEGRSGYERIRDWSQGGSFWGDENTAGQASGSSSSTVNVNVNQQVSRSDVAAIANETSRQEVRQ